LAWVATAAVAEAAEEFVSDLVPGVLGRSCALPWLFLYSMT